ncbi:hypothetical protein [uncultured Nocardioides sp.]|uniref:Uncharacterized protein n=1 Tax=uncultured Nocardioides sp. TaxID=198441 RepID=A0A6J4N1Y7_9ACTN|nr:hypothetical protein [uncultured Nocardioides sp.]CAA9375739.1 MAG: hypothetical protein AVDCRST_MAG06-482 [uncultured Nocardioides sp.]
MFANSVLGLAVDRGRASTPTSAVLAVPSGVRPGEHVGRSLVG